MRRTTKLAVMAVISLPLLTACSVSTTFVDANEAVGNLSDITGCQISDQDQTLEPAFNGVPPFSERKCILDLGGDEYRLFTNEGVASDSAPSGASVAG